MKKSTAKTPNSLTMSLILAIVVVAITIAFNACSNNKTASTSETTTTTVTPTEAAVTTTTTAATSTEATVTTTSATNDTSDDDIICFNYQTREICSGSTTFVHSDDLEEGFKIALLGVKNPDKIEVEGWTCVAKEVSSNSASSLVYLTLSNYTAPGVTTLRGSILYDGELLLTLHDGTPY